MRKIAEDYYRHLSSTMTSIQSFDLKTPTVFYVAVERAAKLVLSCGDQGNKLMFIGNGASAGIASHMSTDYWKNGGIRAVAFNDSSLLTCISNDYGYKHVFEKPVEMFANAGDILFAISSSGKSKNILRAVAAAKTKGCKIMTFSGFEKDNPLVSLGDYNFYVPAKSYGLVEVLHLSICHCILDTIIEYRSPTQKP